MTEARQAGRTPEALAALFNAYANAGDVDGLVSLYEPDATLAAGEIVARGHAEIRSFYRRLLERKSVFEQPETLPAIINDGIALTAARSANGALSIEVARRQDDGTWLWTIDQLKVSQATKA